MAANEFFLTNFENYKKEGLKAYAGGDYPRARYALLKASEYLFKLSEKSDGLIRKSRIENANKLLVHCGCKASNLRIIWK